MANIRKRGVKWQVQVRRQGFPTISKTFTTKPDAQQWARQMEVMADRKDLLHDPKVLEQYTVRCLFKRYLKEVTPHKRCADYEAIMINAFLRTEIAKVRLHRVKAQDFASYRDVRLCTVTAATLNREFNIYQHVFETAMNDWGLPLKVNPVKETKRPKVLHERDRRISLYEQQQILIEANRCLNPYIKPIIQIALATAMRRGEILNIQRSHINETRRTLLIPQTKNGHARTIPLSPKAIQILKHQYGQAEKLFPISANAFRLSWVRLLNRTDIKDLHFHDCRREAISRFFERGLSVPEVALISGHRDFRVLAKHYTKIEAETIAQKLTRM